METGDEYFNLMYTVTLDRRGVARATLIDLLYGGANSIEISCAT